MTTDAVDRPPAGPPVHPVIEPAGVRAPVATPGFRYDAGRLTCDGLALDAVAQAAGTPCYVYDAEGIRDRYRSLTSALAGALPPEGAAVHYAVKACPNVAVLRLLVGLGAGMDVVSVGELERAWLAGCPMERVCFAGVAKEEHELRAALDGSASPIARAAGLVLGRDIAGRGPVGAINAESEDELRLLDAVATGLGVRAPAAIRVNPGVAAGHEDKVRVGGPGTKFGVTPDEAVGLARWVARRPSLRFAGLHMHIGSQIYDLGCFDAALAVLAETADRIEAAGVGVPSLDVGGGFAVSYAGEAAPSDEAFAAVLGRRLAGRAAAGTRVSVEPGRELVAQAGVLLTRVVRTKTTGGRTFVVTDAGLNALVRPAMYGARHMVWPAACEPRLAPDPIAPPPRAEDTPGLEPVDVVGPVCESSDVFQRGWAMPRVGRGDVLAVFTAGAYGMSMAMAFNDLPLPAEVLIDRGAASVIRERQGLGELLAPSGAGQPRPLSVGP